MTLTDIASALGVPTAAELAAELGIPESELRPAELERPTLVLDYRGGIDARTRWERFAKPPLPEIRKPLDLDRVTGLRKVATTMTPSLQTLFDVSTRIREYEAAAHALEGLARLATDVQVRATLRQQAQEIIASATEWRLRQDADLIDTKPSASDPSSSWQGDGKPRKVTP